jgi:hypothetical protein
MYEFEIFKIDSNAHVRTCYGDFYKEIRDKGYIKYYHQLFTYAFLVGLKENKLCNKQKTHDMFMVNNIDKKNFDVIIGIALAKFKDVKNGKELLDKIMQYADGGVEILKEKYELDKTIDNLCDYI